MSTEQNTNLLERAAELIDRVQGHPSGYDKYIIEALDNNDLEKVQYWVVRVEGELANEHFKNYDLAVL